MYSVEEITMLGIECLTERLGVVGMESFIKTVKRESFDYTAWRRSFYDRMEDSDVDDELEAYCHTHEYDGKAQVI